MIKVKIYLDLIFALNYFIDFTILLIVGILLKRKIKMYRFLLGAFFGSASLFTLFIRLNSLELFFIKFLISIIMILITFGFNNIKSFIKNVYYLYMTSIIYGGIMYFFKDNYNQKVSGLLFTNKSPSMLFTLLSSLIVIIIYVKNIKDLKENYNNYYNVEILIDNKTLKLNGFLDTGNKLTHPYSKSPIILINKNLIDEKNKKIIYVPFSSVNNNNNNLLKCIKLKKIYINNNLIKKNFLVGLMDEINIDGVDCILNTKLLEGIND